MCVWIKPWGVVTEEYGPTLICSKGIISKSGKLRSVNSLRTQCGLRLPVRDRMSPWVSSAQKYDKKFYFGKQLKNVPCQFMIGFKISIKKKKTSCVHFPFSSFFFSNSSHSVNRLNKGAKWQLDSVGIISVCFSFFFFFFRSDLPPPRCSTGVIPREGPAMFFVLSRLPSLAVLSALLIIQCWQFLLFLHFLWSCHALARSRLPSGCLGMAARAGAPMFFAPSVVCLWAPLCLLRLNRGLRRHRALRSPAFVLFYAFQNKGFLSDAHWPLKFDVKRHINDIR